MVGKEKMVVTRIFFFASISQKFIEGLHVGIVC